MMMDPKKYERDVHMMFRRLASRPPVLHLPIRTHTNDGATVDHGTFFPNKHATGNAEEDSHDLGDHGQKVCHTRDLERDARCMCEVKQWEEAGRFMVESPENPSSHLDTVEIAFDFWDARADSGRLWTAERLECEL